MGEPVLLIMGLGYPSDMWWRTRPVLDGHYRTIVLDNRGSGRSEVPPGPYPIPLMAADAVAVLDAAGVEGAHVVGISMGGMIAQELALEFPNRVRSLILGCTAAGGKTAIRAEPEATELLVNRGAMTPEQAAVAAIPYVYDPAPRVIASRRTWLFAVPGSRSPRGTGATAGDPGVGVVQPVATAQRADARDSWRNRSTGAVGKRRTDRRADSGREAGDAAARQPHLPYRSDCGGEWRDPGVSGRGIGRRSWRTLHDPCPTTAGGAGRRLGLLVPFWSGPRAVFIYGCWTVISVVVADSAPSMVATTG